MVLDPFDSVILDSISRNSKQRKEKKKKKKHDHYPGDKISFFWLFNRSLIIINISFLCP